MTPPPSPAFSEQLERLLRERPARGKIAFGLLGLGQDVQHAGPARRRHRHGRFQQPGEQLLDLGVGPVHQPCGAGRGSQTLQDVGLVLLGRPLDCRPHVRKLVLHPRERVPGRDLVAVPGPLCPFRALGEPFAVPPPLRLHLAAGRRHVRRELADRLEHPVTGPELTVAPAKEALVEERLERVGLGAADRFRLVVRTASREDRQRAEQALLVLAEQVVRPRDRRPQRVLARIRVPAPGEQVEPLAEPVEQLVRREDRGSRCGEFQREREVVEPLAERGHGRRRGEGRIERAGARSEQFDAVAPVERRHGPDVLALELESLAARHEHLDTFRAAQGSDVCCDRGEEVLRVVEEQEPPRPGEPLDERFGERARRLRPNVERVRDRLQHGPRVTEGRQRHPRRPVGERLGRLGRRLQRQACLARAAGAGQRHEADVVARDERRDLAELLYAPEERRRRDREVRPVERLERRKAFVAELPDPFRGSQVFQAVLAEISQPVRVDLRTRGGESSTWPPWPAAAIRAARWTSMPT